MLSEKAILERDRRLRRQLLFALYLSLNAPKAGMYGAALVTNVNEVADAGMEFDDADHALRLMRDLANKGLILEQRLTRRRGQAFGPEFLFLRITDRGAQLCREEIEPDRDIYDDRVTDE
jgi:hypothetical protein